MAYAPQATVEEKSIELAVSNAMSSLYKEQFGLGPRRVRTDFAGPDVLITTLHGSLTPAERRLADSGEHQRVRDVRLYFQYATEEQFRDAVEQVTTRKVTTVVSGVDTVEDVSLEAFYMEPEAA